MALSVFINFNGDAGEAIKFYEGVFGTKAKNVMKYKDMPGGDMSGLPPETAEWIMYSDIEVPGGIVMAADAPPQEKVTFGTNMTISLAPETKEETEKIFNGLSEGGEVYMPLQETFWSPYYGMLRDKYGHNWMVSMMGKEMMS